MVFFTCNACGQAIKKAQVEKHYMTQCRNCEVLSCIDCGTDFYGDDYKQHTQCISENEKYGGKDYQAPNKANKGEAKQEQWLQCVRESCKGEDISPNVRNLLERVAEYPNVPRKKSKFENFLRNSLKLHNPKVMEQIWSVFSAASGKQETPSKSMPSSCKPSESDASSLEQAEEGGVEEKLPSIESTTEDPPQGRKTKQNKTKKLKKEEADDSKDDLDSTVAPEGLDATAAGDHTFQENAKRTKNKSKKKKIREEKETADLKSHGQSDCMSGSVEGSFEHVKEKKKSKKKELTEKSDVFATTVKDHVPSIVCISTDSSSITERYSTESGGRVKKKKRGKQHNTDKQMQMVAADVSRQEQKQDRVALAHCRNHKSPETEIESLSPEKKRKKKAKGKCENHSDGDGDTLPKSDLAVCVGPTAMVRKKTKKQKSESDDISTEKRRKENNPSKDKDGQWRERKSVDCASSVTIDSSSVDAKTDSDSSKKVDGKKKKKAKSAKGTNKVKSATETESNTVSIVGSVVSALPDMPKRRKRKMKSSDAVPEIALKKTKKKKVDSIHIPPKPSDIVPSPSTAGAVGSERSASAGRVKSEKKRDVMDFKAELILSDKEKVKKKKNLKQEEVAAFNASPKKLDVVGKISTDVVKKKVKKSKKIVGTNVSKEKTKGRGQSAEETTGLQTKKKAKKANSSEIICQKCMSLVKVASPKQNGNREIGKSGGSVQRVKKRKRKLIEVASPEIVKLGHMESSPQGEPSNKKCKSTKSVKKKNHVVHPDDKESDHVHGKVRRKKNRESQGAAVTGDARLVGTETDHVPRKVKKKKNLGKLNENLSDNTKGEDKESDHTPKCVKKRKNHKKRGKTITDDAGDGDRGTEDVHVSLCSAALNGTVTASQMPKKAKKVKKVKVKIISSPISKKLKKGGKEKTSAGATHVGSEKKVKISRKKVGLDDKSL